MNCSENTRYFEILPKGWTKRTTIVRELVAAISLTGVRAQGSLVAPPLLVASGVAHASQGVRFEAEPDPDEVYDDHELAEELGDRVLEMVRLNVEHDKLPHHLVFNGVSLSVPEDRAFNFAHVVINYFVERKYHGILSFTREVPGAASPDAACSVYVDSWRAEIPEFAIVEGERQPPCLIIEWDPDAGGSEDHFEHVLNVCEKYGLRELGARAA